MLGRQAKTKGRATRLIESASYNNRLQPCNLQVATGAFTWLNRANNFYPTPGVNCQPGSGGNNGNVMSIADNLQSNRTQTFGYDSLNRITSAQTQGTSGPDCWAQSFGYDAWANLVSATPTRVGCPMTQLSIGVNTKNQITNSGFSYDAAGNLLTDGISIYVYDGENRIKTVNGTGAAYIYDADGQRVEKQVGSDATDYVYFGGQPIAERKTNGDWSDYIYAGSRRLARADSYEDRLHIYGTECNCGFQWYQFSLPSAGGLAGYTIQQGDLLMWRQTQFTASGGLNMAFTDGGAQTYGVLFDQDGYDMNTDGLHSVWHYRRVNMNLEAGRTVSLLTLSVNGTQSGRWDLYFNDIVLVSQDGTVRPIYTRETGISLAGFGSSGMTGTGYEVNHDTNAGGYSQVVATTFYHGDHLGSARMMTSENGYPTWSSTFLPFGQEWNPQVTMNHYKFTGKERDSESGLDNFGARYDSSQYGRFMTPDPNNAGAIDEDPQSWNGYAYVRNNPLRYTDPDGLSFHVCIKDQDGKDQCTNYENDSDFYKAVHDSPGASASGGNIYANGQSVGSYQHYGSGTDDTVGTNNVSSDFLNAYFAGQSIRSVFSLGRLAYNALVGAGSEAVAGTAGAASNVIASGTKQAVRDALDSGAVSSGQRAAVKSALNRAGNNATVTLERLADGSLKVSTRVPAEMGGFGNATYVKTIDPQGNTVSVAKEVYDKAGKFIFSEPK